MSGTLREHKPSVPDIAPWCAALYASENGGAGCCLHITLDDNNIEDHSVEFCIQTAVEIEHWHCAMLARALRSMSKTQRTKLAGHPRCQPDLRWLEAFNRQREWT